MKAVTQTAVQSKSVNQAVTGVLQRKCACGTHTMGGGQCADCAKNKSGLQRKLAIGASNDPLEQESDRVADQVLAAPAHFAVSGAPPRIQRYAGQATEGTDTAPASVDRVLASSGRPLEPALRQDMEQRFGHDFSRVRVHSGVAAEQSARELNAQAYTVGHDIAFGSGRFEQGTEAGRRLIAHELTHVVQQAGSDGIGVGHGMARVSLECGVVQRQSEGPTIGNMPREDTIPAKRVKLVEVNGKWREVRPGTPQRTAIGRYDYVLKDGELWAVRRSAGVDQKALELYGRRPGHTEAAGGGRVTYAGQVQFSKSGQVTRWDEATGHFLSATSLRKPVVAAGFPKDKFVASEEVAAGRKGPNPDRGPQLPVFQPKTRPKGEGPVKVPPGPPRMEALEARYPASTKAPPVTTTTPVQKTSTGPSGGGPGSTGPGGARPVAETKPTAIAGRGAPVSGIVAPPHAQRIHATRGAMQGAWSMILSAQLSYVRGAELKKALDALAALEPTIEQQRQKGIDVTVTVIAEIPDRPDVAALATGVGDPSQVVRFRDMFISHLSLPPSAATSTVSTMYDAGGHSRDYVGLGDMTLDQQIRFQFGDKYPVPGTEPRTGFHFAEGKQVLPGYAQPKAAQPASPMATRTKGITGTWMPEFREVFVGDINQVMPLVARALKVDVDASGAATPRMTQGSRAYAFENGGPNTTMVMTGRFKMGEGYPPQAQWYWSSFEYHPEKGLILEWARGHDMVHDKLWDALFLWRRL